MNASHVSMLHLSPSPHYDYCLATLMVLLLLCGVPGNLLALKYFTSKPNRDLATCLYIAICVVDTTTCLSHVPVIVTLVARRQPGLFGHVSVCTGWKVLFSFLQQFSMFLVTMMSVSRMVAIVFPFHNVSKRRCLVALNLYIVILVVVDVVEAAVSSIWYDSDTCFCYFTARYARWGMAIEACWLLKVGLPAIISFVSFTVICYEMRRGSRRGSRRRGSRPPGKEGSRRRGSRPPGKEGALTRAAVTVSLFTGLFLLCNLPFFLISALYTVSLFGGYSYPAPFFTSHFMRRYSWLIAKVFCTVLNAALNPLLYCWRMYRFKAWLCSKVTDFNTSTIGVSSPHIDKSSQGTPPQRDRTSLGSPPHPVLVRSLSLWNSGASIGRTEKVNMPTIGS